jgi:hypothetical protein
MESLSGNTRFDAKLIAFWTDLKKGFDHFEKHQTLPNITINAEGSYITR